ncbi:hypothetical protein DIPPA_14300 [Diplonema papillatum]|nr:hypothetical protein DIPPA_14300 [Diplonema papillatum]
MKKRKVKRDLPPARLLSPAASALLLLPSLAKRHSHEQILAYYDDNQEKALAAIFDSNLPPQLVEDTSKAAASSPSGTREPTNHRPPRRPVTALTNPERFVPIGALLKKKKPDEDAEFDELLRQRVVASQRKFEYEDEVDDSCDYMPGGALEEEKRRKQLQSMSFKKIGADSGDGPLSEAVAADCPSDEEWGGYGESDDEEEEDDTQTGQTGGKGHKGGKNGNRGDGFPRAISGESTGEKKGNSGRRRATATDQQTRNFLDKNKSRFANHNRKAQADRKRRTML